MKWHRTTSPPFKNWHHVSIGLIGGVLFFYALFDGVHYLREQKNVQFGDVEGIASGLFFICLSIISQNRITAARVAEIERRLADISTNITPKDVP